MMMTEMMMMKKILVGDHNFNLVVALLLDCQWIVLSQFFVIYVHRSAQSYLN